MSVVPISISCVASSFKPKNACSAKRRSSKAAPVSVATRFSFLSRGQFVQPLSLTQINGHMSASKELAQGINYYYSRT